MKPFTQGYIALMASIIVSIVLFAIVVGQAFLGSVVRFMVLGSETKEQSNTLAQSCVRVAHMEHLADPAYTGGATYVFTVFTESECTILPLQFNTPSPGHTTVKAKAVVQKAQTNIEVVVDQNFDTVSLNEVSNF